MLEYVGIQISLRTKLRRDKRLSEAQMRSKRRTCLKFVSSGGKMGVETHTSGLTGSKSKVETFETSEIFPVREESGSSRGGATVIIGSITVKDLDRQIIVQTTRSKRRGEQISVVRSECKRIVAAQSR
jgi:hypothetical protein